MRFAALTERKRLFRGNVVLIALRLLLALVSLFVLLQREVEMIKPYLRIPPPSQALDVPLYLKPEGLVVLIVLALTVLYGLALRRSELAEKLAVTQVLVDIGLISALVYDTGGPLSPFLTFYLVSLAAAAFVVGERWVWTAASLAALSFGLITVLYAVGLVPHPSAHRLAPGQLADLRKPELVAPLLLLPLCALLVVGALAGRLAGRLAHTQVLHAKLLAGLDEGVLLLDPRGRPAYQNAAMEKLMGGLDSAEQSAAALNSFPSLAAAMREALAQGRSRRVECSWKRPDHRMVPLLVRVYPVPKTPYAKEGDAAGGVLVVADDVSAEKKMEDLLIRQSRIEALGRLAAAIAHEIRNPLASIRGAVQELGRLREIPPAKRELIEIVLGESDRLDRIITDFLQFARLPSPKPRPVNVAKLLEEMKMLLKSRDDAGDVDVVVEMEKPIPDFQADPEQLRQALLNLGANALQSMEGRQNKKIVLRAQPARHSQIEEAAAKLYAADETDKAGVIFEVKDNGWGINAEAQANIFEPFFSTKTGGTGLGLAVVARIVQGHNGVVVFRSEPDRGTSFRLWFPFKYDKPTGETGMIRI